MLLADMGADVVRIDRIDAAQEEQMTPVDLGRGRRSIAVDLKSEAGRELVLGRLKVTDVLIEGFRPGVMERLGLGPDVCRARNPRLIYGRMTGWGQEGPLSNAVGHDINYISIAGVTGAIGPVDGPPVVPLNLVGDFGGGGMLLVYGIVLALLESTRSGEGQVIDAAMVDGASLLMSLIHNFASVGSWSNRRGSNLLDGGAPFYASCATSDGRYVAVGALEPQFFADLVHRLHLSFDPADQYDQSRWPALRAQLTAAFAERTRDEWVALFDGSDACVSPVLDLSEALDHPHAKARGTFIEVDGRREPAPLLASAARRARCDAGLRPREPTAPSCCATGG